MAHRENKDGKVPLGNEKSPSGTFLPWRENGGQAIHSGRVQNAVSRRRLWLPSKRRKGACNAVMPWCEKTAGEKTLRPSCCNPQFLNSQLNYPVPKREAVHRTLQREPLASGRPFLKQVAQVLHQISPILSRPQYLAMTFPGLSTSKGSKAFLMAVIMNICPGSVKRSSCPTFFAPIPCSPERRPSWA